jgi:hypothetical protein
MLLSLLSLLAQYGGGGTGGGSGGGHHYSTGYWVIVAVIVAVIVGAGAWGLTWIARRRTRSQTSSDQRRTDRAA